jgi:hypothetical protein
MVFVMTGCETLSPTAFAYVSDDQVLALRALGVMAYEQFMMTRPADRTAVADIQVDGDS